jgi:predicted transcriptional regulator
LDRELHYCLYQVHDGGDYQMAESEKLTLVASITASYLRRNSISVDQIGVVVSSVTHALEQASKEIAGTTTGDGQGSHVVEPSAGDIKIQPAVSIKKSIQPEHIVCLEDGFPAKTLKRHLRVAHGLTPQQYREKWRLPKDYPIVAPAYSKRRSMVAKEIGLGRKPGATTVAKAKGRPRKAMVTRATAKAR